ncbi:carnitine/acyl carnitine carrier [Rickenella mellea]|uniref:Carnitine/acyl carnitine carrier n=1 Tax=Rickenella mellea TaxID=50990 RepID=A0A4Y7QID6_9AGAM|nr:carnitine/acyl carnitine carrier [Rickenella mellea]
MTSVEDRDEKPKLDPTVDFVAGTVAGIAGLVVGYPLDTVKVRFQNPQTSSKYKSTFNAVATIIREERVRGLYKGITSPMAGAAFLNGLVFASYGFLMRLQLKSDAHEPTLSQIALAGAGSGIISSVITCPTEFIKIRQQSTLHTQSSARDVALRIFRTHGIRGLYRGLTATALRDCGYGAYFATYEATCRYLKKNKSSQSGDEASYNHSSLINEAEADIDRLPWHALLLAGGLAGVNGWLTTFAFDVVKTRVQSVDYQHHPSPGPTTLARKLNFATVRHPYQTTLSTILHSYRTEGVGVFFRGLSPTLIRAIPVNMATFSVFEAIVHVLSW